MITLVETSQILTTLLDPGVYPDHPLSVLLKETHLSWVFLTDHFAYKLRKPVRYGVQDFTTLEARFSDAELEIKLNRRLSEDVYLEVVPVTFSTDSGLMVQGSGKTVEWMVKMRRLPADRMMDCLISSGRLSLSDIRAVSAHLAKFYKQAPAYAVNESEYLLSMQNQIEFNYETLSSPEFGLPPVRLLGLHRILKSFLKDFAELFRGRVQQGHVVDGHGDLRPEYICIEKGNHVNVFDCLQFSRDLRIMDSLDELSFLALECERIGSAESGFALLKTYAELADDHPPDALSNFYKATRAILWAALALWRTKELPQAQWGKWLDRAHKYIGLSEKYAAHLPVLS